MEYQVVLVSEVNYKKNELPLEGINGCQNRWKRKLIWYDIFNCNWVATQWQ